MTNNKLTHFYKTLYEHHLLLYNKRRFTEESGLFNLNLANLYSSKLIEMGKLTKEEHKTNLLPIVDTASLLAPKYPIQGEGDE